MDRAGENYRGLTRSSNSRGLPMNGVKLAGSEMGTSNNRRALRDIKNFVGAPPYPCGMNKSKVPLDDKSLQQGAVARRPITRRFAASLATKSQACQQIVNRNNYNDDKYAKEFGIQVVNQLVSVDAHVLPPPRLQSGKDKVVNPEVGQWNMNNKKMVNGGIVENWTCVNFSSFGEDAIRHFCYDLVQMYNKIGMKFVVDPLIEYRSDHSDRIDAVLKDIHSQSKEAVVGNEGRGKQLQMLFVVLPDDNCFYEKIKRICETELGIVSQCFSPKNLPKNVSRYNKYLENVAQQINAKGVFKNDG